MIFYRINWQLVQQDYFHAQQMDSYLFNVLIK